MKNRRENNQSRGMKNKQEKKQGIDPLDGFNASARYLRFSPYKLRPIVDIVRGKNVKYALDWLATYATKRALPIEKVIKSAAANAKSLHDISPADLIIKEVRVDEGPMFRYFKPGAMGRTNTYRKRSSHIEVVLEPVAKREV